MPTKEEEHAHDHGGNGPKFAENCDPAKLFHVVKIIGQHSHDGGGSDAHEEGELRQYRFPDPYRGSCR